MKQFIFVLMILFCCTAYAEEYSLKDIQRAACRVRVSGGTGTGTVIARENGKYWILTNDHVTGMSKTCTVEFYYDGFRSRPAPGQVVFRRRSDGNPKYDISLISVDESFFGPEELHPLVIPIAPRNTTLSRDDYIFGCGNPQGLWLYSWQSRVISVSDRIMFNRPPIGGESGSAILSNINGQTYVVGIVTWSIGSQGGGVPLEAIHRAFAGEAKFIEPQKKLPSNFRHVSYPEEYTNVHVRGSDGRLYDGRIYKDGRRTGINMPYGVYPVEFGVPCQEQCPNCPPQGGGGFFGGGRGGSQIPPQGGQGGGGIWGDKPPISIEKPKENNPIPSLPNVNDKKIKELEDKIKELEGKLAELDALKSANKVLTDQATVLNEKIAQLTKEKEDLKNQLDSLISQKATIESQIDGIKNMHEEEKLALAKSVGELEAQNKTLEMKVQDAEQKLKSTEDQLKQILEDAKNGKYNTFPDILMYIYDYKEGKISLVQLLILVLGGFGLFFGGRWLTNKTGMYFTQFLVSKLREVAHDIITKDSDEESKKKVIDNKKPEEITLADCDNSTGQPKPIICKDNGVRPVEKVYNKVEGQPLEVTINNSVSTQSGKPQDFTVVEPVMPPSQTSEYIRQWAGQKRKDGEKIEHTAMYASLYREAMKELRHGTLIKDFVGDGQRKAAEKIDEYVQNKFHLQMTCDKLEGDMLLNEAMIAFLYREAVQLLKDGKFGVLGCEQIANAINTWVRKEFYRRLGIHF